MQQGFSLRMFLVLALFLSGIAMFFWVDEYRVYQGEVTVLVTGSDVARANRVASDIPFLVSTQRFAREMKSSALSTGTLRSFTDMSEAELTRVLRESLSVKRSDDSSGVLSLSVVNEEQDMALSLSRTVAETLPNMIKTLYGNDSSIRVEIVDEPRVAPMIVSPFRIALMSIFAGVFLALSVFVMWSLLGWMSRMGTILLAQPKETASGESITAETFRPVRPRTLYGIEDAPKASIPVEEIPEERGEGTVLPTVEEKAPSVPAIPPTPRQPIREEKNVSSPAVPTFEKKGGAPSNLPFADDALLAQFGIASHAHETVSDVPSAETMIESPVSGAAEMSSPLEEKTEPTVEEYKRRLNELLRYGK